MASTAKIEAASITSPSSSVVTSGGWAVDYDWSNDRVTDSGVPWRLGFPAPFDRNLTGLVPGQNAYSEFYYVFSTDTYLRCRTDGTVDGDDSIASQWGLPPGWMSVDAVFTGGGAKSSYTYFFNGGNYCRFDWNANKMSPPNAQAFGTNWHVPPSFAAGIDGSITGAVGYSTKAYLFTTLPQTVDYDGKAAAAGFRVNTTAYARYDYDKQTLDLVETNPPDVTLRWPGLLPMLDVGPAIDLALKWIDETLRVLKAGPPTPATATAFDHHFGTGGAVLPAVLGSVITNFETLQTTIGNLPTGLRWLAGLGVAAQTWPGDRIEIGDKFSLIHGPNGRAAVLIHEAVHLTFGAGEDVPEWSGATIDGLPRDRATDPTDGHLLPAYSDLTTAAALTNPSSYAGFAQEIALHSDERFGAARLHQ